MLVKFPITFAKCLKYLCLASKRVVQWLIRGPYLNGTCKAYYTHIDKLAILQYTHISFELAHISKPSFRGESENEATIISHINTNIDVHVDTCSLNVVESTAWT